MNETNRIKLHPALEILIIGAIDFAISTLLNIIQIYFIRIYGIKVAIPFSYIISFASHFGAVIAAIICLKLIEHVKINIIVLSTVSYLTSFLLMIISNIIVIALNITKPNAVLIYSYASTFLHIVLSAIIIVLFSHILPHKKDTL